MTSRAAYDLLARDPRCTARGVGRLLEAGQTVEEVAARLASPQEPPSLHPFVTPGCPGYPPLLKELKDPPLRLFHLGQPPEQLAHHCVAVVGSRRASSYGISWARRLGAALARNGISVCSGLAEGIDAAAHRGALEAHLAEEGRAALPAAVLGHGTGHIYPKSNTLLRKQMEERGIVFSEYPPQRPPARYTFPERNRIIAGMCQSVVVVEASLKSGSLHTARFALEAGRDVWAVPNRPGTPNSAGVLGLLRDGANPMFDIDEFVGQLVQELRVTHPLPKPPALPPALMLLLRELAQSQVGHLSELCQRLACTAPQLAGWLVELELLGLTERRYDGSWVLRDFELVEQHLQLCRERAA